jgi:hypothetical protein
MKATLHCGLVVAILMSASAYGSVQDILQDYVQAGAGPFDPAAGEAAWVKAHRPTTGQPRSCSSCHGSDLTRAGRHVTTGKPIEPLAVSANPSRLSDPRKVETWFRRNCRWTLGRDCTPQEKGDFIRYISNP